MKKTLALLITALLLLSLAACGGHAGNNSGETDAATDAGTATESAPAETADPASAPNAPAAQALLPGSLYQLDDPAQPVLRGLRLAGNRCGSAEFNARPVAATDIRCIFELNEWVEVTPDTDAGEGLAVWVFRHRDDPDAYKDASLSEETPGFAAFCELPFDPEANAAFGSFYLSPDDAEPGYYDFVFTLEGKPTALLLTRFYSEGELEEKSDDELLQLTRDPA